MKKILSLLLVCALVLTFAGCSKACEDLELSKDSITFTREGQTKGLNVKTDPKDTTDEVEFESDDEDVATVNEDGLIRAEGPGETTITVRCGDEVAYCEVICDFDGGSNDDREDDEQPSNDDDEDESENDCDTCGGSGKCPECHGNYRCPECIDSNGKCPRCNGDEEITCRTCDGHPSDVCKECDGDGITGEGSSYEWDCTYCVDGKTCPKCDGEGVESCPDCTDGYCPECDGEKIICDECDKGNCPDCS